MAEFIPQSPLIPNPLQLANGFILLEVLVAMSIVTGSWMALGNTYQQMVLRLGQLQEQREQMKQALDQHELALVNASQSKNQRHQARKSLHESTGMSRRSRPVSRIDRASHQK